VSGERHVRLRWQYCVSFEMTCRTGAFPPLLLRTSLEVTAAMFDTEQSMSCCIETMGSTGAPTSTAEN